MTPADLSGRTALVTGASRGIGLEVARGLLERGARVLFVSRDRARGEHAVGGLEPALAERAELVSGDLSRVDETLRIAEEVKSRTARLDLLVNNAGVFQNARHTTSEGLELTFAVNQMAPLLLTRELLELLRASPASRVVTVSSEAHRRSRFDLTDLQSEVNYRGMTAYANSKLANILFTAELARRESDSAITAVALHPGVVDTGLLGNYIRDLPWIFRIFAPLFRGAVSLEAHAAAAGVLRLAADMDDATLARHAGCYFTGGHVRDAAPDATSEATALVWWEAVEHAIGARTPASSA
jgi:NAD(P)-dependent dehydrogenase (short-subunit alcohol dehydrogenase family)